MSNITDTTDKRRGSRRKNRTLFGPHLSGRHSRCAHRPLRQNELLCVQLFEKALKNAFIQSYIRDDSVSLIFCGAQVWTNTEICQLWIWPTRKALTFVSQGLLNMHSVRFYMCNSLKIVVIYMQGSAMFGRAADQYQRLNSY